MAKVALLVLLLLVAAVLAEETTDFTELYASYKADPNHDWNHDPTIFQAVHAAEVKEAAVPPPPVDQTPVYNTWTDPSLSVYTLCEQLLGRKE